jgi:hypothetical protein
MTKQKPQTPWQKEIARTIRTCRPRRPKPTPTLDLLSIGKMSELLQQPVRTIQRRLDLLKIEPTLFLNDVPYYQREAVTAARTK